MLGAVVYFVFGSGWIVRAGFLPLDGLFLPREPAPLPFLESFFLFPQPLFFAVGMWELKVVVSEAHACEISFRLFARPEELRWPLLDACLPLPGLLEDVLRWPPLFRWLFLPPGLRLFWPRRCEELD